jgi:3-oxoacyl-[acyl-carrier protein] reductase
MIDPKLKDKVVFITGANHGIGAATARLFGTQAAKVFITYYIPPAPFSDEELESERKNGTGGERLYLAMQQQTGETVAAQIRSASGTGFVIRLTLETSTALPDCSTSVKRNLDLSTL